MDDIRVVDLRSILRESAQFIQELQDDLVRRAAPGDPHQGQRHCTSGCSLLLQGEVHHLDTG